MHVAKTMLRCVACVHCADWLWMAVEPLLQRRDGPGGLSLPALQCAEACCQGFAVPCGPDHSFTGLLKRDGSVMIRSTHTQRMVSRASRSHLTPLSYSFCDCTQSGCLLRVCMKCMQPCKTHSLGCSVCAAVKRPVETTPCRRDRFKSQGQHSIVSKPPSPGCQHPTFLPLLALPITTSSRAVTGSQDPFTYTCHFSCMHKHSVDSRHPNLDLTAL